MVSQLSHSEVYNVEVLTKVDTNYFMQTRNEARMQGDIRVE